MCFVLEIRRIFGTTVFDLTINSFKFLKKLLNFLPAEPEPTDSDRHRTGPNLLGWTGTSLGPVGAGPFRLFNGLCLCLNSASTGTDH